MTLFATIALTAACSSSGAPDVPASQPDRLAQATTSRARAPEHCPHAQQAISYYRRAYTTSRTRMGLAGAPARHWLGECATWGARDRVRSVRRRIPARARRGRRPVTTPRRALPVTQPALFDPKTTGPTACPAPGCPAVRLPGQAQVVTCPYDLEIDTARKKHGRPRGCLNTSQGNLPETF